MIRNQIDVWFYLSGNNLENTWSFMSPEKGEPWYNKSYKIQREKLQCVIQEHEEKEDNH